MITYSYKNGIFEVKLSGKIDFEEIINYLKDFTEIENLPSDLQLLYDLENVEFGFTMAEIKMISHAAELSTKNYKSVKTAFIVNKPKVTAYSSLFSESVLDKRTTRKIFSSREAALKWLDS